MSRSLLPPRGIFASTRLLFDRRLSANLKETTLQLMALTWGNSDCCTPPLSVTQLAALTGKGERTLRGHLKALNQMEGVLTLQRTEQDILTITLASWLFHSDEPAPPPVDPPAVPPVDPGPGERARPQAAAGRRTRSAAGVEARGGPAKSGGLAKSGGAVQSGPVKARLLSKKLRADLVARGLFPSLLPEVSASPYSEADLRALLAWCSVDAPERPAGLFMGRLRAGAHAPVAYRSAPCPVCGQYGKHAATCRRRFAQDIYNSG